MCPAVSINLCCFDSEQYLEETLQSVFNQTYKDWELVIVNDGSTDLTETIIQKHISEGWPILYHSQANAGLANARNKALELSSGRYIAFLDHDDLWLPEKLALQIQLLEARPDIAVIYANASVIDGYGNIIAERYDNNFESRDGDIFLDLLIKGAFINWQTVVIRHTVLDSVGGFRSYRIAEDFDMLLRCAVNRTCLGMDHILVKYRKHDRNYSAVRFSNDHDELRRSNVEEKLELANIYEYWVRSMPPLFSDLRPLLQKKIAELHYEIGKSFFLLGNTEKSKSHLRKSLTNSPRRCRTWAANVVVSLPGDRFFRRVMRALRAIRIQLRNFIPQSKL